MIFAFGGFVAFIASEEFSRLDGALRFYQSAVVCDTLMVYSHCWRHYACLLHDGSVLPVTNQGRRRWMCSTPIAIRKSCFFGSPTCLSTLLA